MLDIQALYKKVQSREFFESIRQRRHYDMAIRLLSIVKWYNVLKQERFDKIYNDIQMKAKIAGWKQKELIDYSTKKVNPLPPYTPEVIALLQEGKNIAQIATVLKERHPELQNLDISIFHKYFTDSKLRNYLEKPTTYQLGDFKEEIAEMLENGTTIYAITKHLKQNYENFKDINDISVRYFIKKEFSPEYMAEIKAKFNKPRVSTILDKYYDEIAELTKNGKTVFFIIKLLKEKYEELSDLTVPQLIYFIDSRMDKNLLQKQKEKRQKRSGSVVLKNYETDIKKLIDEKKSINEILEYLSKNNEELSKITYTQLYNFCKSKSYKPNARQSAEILEDYLDEIAEKLNDGMAVNAILVYLRQTYEELSTISYTMVDNFIKKNNLK